MLIVENHFAIGVTNADETTGERRLARDLFGMDQFEECVVVEEAGGILPTFELRFRCTRSDVFNDMLHEGTRLRISLGQTRDDLRDYPMRITQVEWTNDAPGIGRNEKLVSISGVLDVLPFLGQAITGWPRLPSSVVMAVVARKFFTYETNVLNSNDRMTWIQYNIPFKQFLEELWVHSFTDSDSYQALGITATGKLRFFNIPALTSSPAPWVFAVGGSQRPAVGDFSGSGTRPSGEGRVDAETRAAIDEALEEIKNIRKTYVEKINTLLSKLQIESFIPKALKGDDYRAILALLRNASGDPRKLKDEKGNDLRTLLVDLLRKVRIEINDDELAELLIAEFAEFFPSFADVEDLKLIVRSHPKILEQIFLDLATQVISFGNSLIVDFSALLADAEGILRESLYTPPQEHQSVVYAALAGQSRSGLFNYLAGANRIQPEHWVQGGVDLGYNPNVRARFSRVLARSQEHAEMNRYWPKHLLNTRNQHENFWRAYAQNIGNLAAMSNINLRLDVADQAYPIEILDTATVLVEDIEGDNQISTAWSGRYLIHKVITTVTRGNFSRMIEMSREGLNSLQLVGNL